MLADEPLTAEAREYLATVRAQSEHLTGMLSDLLTLAGLNTGTLSIEVSPVHVANVLARLRPLADELRGDKSVHVEWDCPGSAAA